MTKRPTTRPIPRRWSAVAVFLATSLFAMVTVACTPPPPTDPINIGNLSNEAAATKLADALPGLEAAFADPSVIAEIPEENRAQVTGVLTKLRTAAGRAELVRTLRTEAYEVQGGFLPRRDAFAGGLLATVAGLSEGFTPDTSLHPTRYVAPPATGATFGFEATSGACDAPGGPTNVPTPSDPTPGVMATPEHDVYAKFSTGTVGIGGFLTSFVPVGAPTIAGDSGVQFRGSGFNYQMHVRVDMHDENHGQPLKALAPIFHIRPIGGTAAQETQVQPVEGNTFCYLSNDGPSTTRGYWDGWIPVPHTEPGFQLITEIVENEFYYRAGGPNFDFFLAAPGPQFFAGADRSTIHVSGDPVSTATPLSHAVGAFATALHDGVAGPNPITDTNAQPADDVEAPIKGLLAGKVRGALSDGMSGDLAQYYALTVQGSMQASPTATADLKYVDLATAAPEITDEPTGTQALEATIAASGDADIYMQLLGIPCFGVTMHVDINVTADIWADSSGHGTGITPRSRHITNDNVDISMPWYDWLLTSCDILFGLIHAKAAIKIPNEVDKAIDGALGENGSMTKILQGFDLTSYLPSLDIDPHAIGNTHTGGASMQPVVTNLDNAWCRAPGAPAGCTVDQDLLGAQGLEVAADTTLLSGHGVGEAFGGRFPNVYSPSTAGSVDALVTTHRDASSQLAGLGIVIDPRLINIALRHLVQGKPTGTTTDGLVDIKDYQTPIDAFHVTTRPEVAPMVISPAASFTPITTSPTVAAVVPDVRLDLKTNPDLPKSIHYSVAASDNIGLAFDPSTNKMSPVFDPPIVDVQTTGGCQVNYDTGYATSYLLCGRGSGGNGGNIASLNDVLDQIANQVVKPVLDDSIGGIELPSLDGLVNGLHLALTNVRFAQRGGFLSLYADIRPFPFVSLVGSTAGYGGDDDTIRFFAVPTNLSFSQGTNFAWEITDGVTNQPVPFTIYPGTFGGGIQFPSNAFTPEDQVNKTKKVIGKLTVTQPGLQVTGNGSFQWNPPGPPEPPNCPGPAPQPAVISNGPGLGGGHTPGSVGCF